MPGCRDAGIALVRKSLEGKNYKALVEDIGSHAENLLRLSPCHVLLTTRRYVPPVEAVAEQTVSWTKEAEARMERVPSFVRNMARMAILRYAQDKGHTVISSSIIDEAMAVFMPQGARQVGDTSHISLSPSPRQRSNNGQQSGEDMGSVPRKGDEDEILWEEDALWELEKIEDPSVKEQVRLRTEKRVKIMGRRYVTREDVV